MSTLGYIPTRITGGESVWISEDNAQGVGTDITISGFLPADYTLAYQFADATPITVAGVANTGGTGWTLELSSAQTLIFAPGGLPFSAFATDTDGRTYLVDQGSMQVDASPLRISNWAAVLTAIDAAIATYAADGNHTVSTDDMSVTAKSMEDLTNLRAWVKNELNRDTAGKVPRRILSRFPV